MERTDRERIDWLEQQFGYGLIDDDNGHVALVFDGFQNSPMTDNPQDIDTRFFIEKHKWCNSVREAIDLWIDENRKQKLEKELGEGDGYRKR